MMNESNHDIKRSTLVGFFKASSPEKIIRLTDGGDKIINELKGTNSAAKTLQSYKLAINELDNISEV